MSKVCSVCKEEKELGGFYKDSSKKDGYQHRCKVCDGIRKNKEQKQKRINNRILNGITMRAIAKVCDTQDHKICIKCDEEKHIDLFQRDYSRPQGRRNICLICRNLVRKYYNASNDLKHLSKQEIIQYREFQSTIGEVKQALKDCEFKIKEEPRWKTHSVYTCSKCKIEKPLTMFFKYSASNTGHDRKCKECSLIGSSDRINRYRHSEHGKAKIKEWILNNQDIVKANGRVGRSKRRALQRNIKEDFKRKDMIEVMDRFNHLCFKCGSKDNIHIDHHVPLSKGGRLTFTNAVILCAVCNVRKSNKDPEMFYTAKELSVLDKKYGVKRDSLFN